MPEVRVDETLVSHYEDDYFGEPWRTRETVLMVHGAAESTLAWYAWVPHLAREYRVIRIDQRGCGASTTAPDDFEWTLDNLARDLDHFLDALGLRAVHVVGAKLGGAVSLAFAANYPRRVLSLSAVGAPVRKSALAAPSPARPANVQRDMRAWAAQSQGQRLGSEVSPEQAAWWTEYMGSADPRGFAGLGVIMSSLNNFDTMHRIEAPTLVITTEGSALGSVEEVRASTAEIPRGELVVLPGDSYHVAASAPDRCAELVRQFIGRHSATEG